MERWRVPGYAELRELGSGGFGDVVAARDERTGVLVAIKYLRPDLLADPLFAEMFRAEAQAMAGLDDPNIVRLREYVESAGGAAIVMELVDGVSLREVLARYGATGPEAALVVLHGSLMGLAAAHRARVVHRDYKPENILIDGHGASKLTDFGLAARSGDRPLPAGTLAYAAPEQLDGQPATPACDVYAATATFYECITGRPPFTGDPAELARQHRTEPVPLDPVPETLRPLVAAGMAKQPADRPADAATLAALLKAAATAGYGPDWHDRGHSYLGEAALLLAALWPTAATPGTQGTAIHHFPPSHPPVPGPGPGPAPTPGPGPAPAPGPAPSPAPAPTSGPAPAPAPGPAPVPAPGLAPSPAPGPGSGQPPAPGPGSWPGSGQPPAPGSGPAPWPGPSPEPVPAPVPMPTSVPALRLPLLRRLLSLFRQLGRAKVIVIIGAVVVAITGAVIAVTTSPPSGTSASRGPAHGPAMAYVVNSSDGTVTPISLPAGTPGAPIRVGNDPGGIAITPDGKTAYVANAQDNTVTPISLPAGTPGTPIPVGNGPEHIAITPDGKTAYVTNSLGNTVTPISLSAGTPGTPIPVGNGPTAIAITPDGKTAYVTNFTDGTVTPISLPAGTPGTPIAVGNGNGPGDITTTPDGKTAYVTNSADGTVTPISLPADAPGTPIPVTGAFRIAISPDGRTAYIINGNHTVIPISLPAGTPGTPIPVGQVPQAIAITP